METCPHCHGSGVVIQTQRTILGQMQTQSVCPHCGGEGRIIKDKCPICHGDGIVRGEDVIEIDIPAFAISAYHASVRNITYSVPAMLLCPWDSPDENTGMGCCFPLQEDALTRDQTRISCIGRWILYH